MKTNKELIEISKRVELLECKKPKKKLKIKKETQKLQKISNLKQNRIEMHRNGNRSIK